MDPEERPRQLADYSMIEYLRFLGVIAAVTLFVTAGVRMQDIESVAGDTTIEAFFHAMAYFCWGMAAWVFVAFLPRKK